MRILLVYPEYPETFWSFKYALKLIGKKSSFPPLGVLTVASLFPEEWEKRVVDMNVSYLKDADIQWADYVCISAMIVQKESVWGIIKKCQKFGKKIIAGGPLFTSGYQEFINDIDYFVLNEGEVTIPQFLEDLEKDRPQKFYQTQEKPSLEKTPIPQWDLIDMSKYASANIQYSRGCPFNCEFCDITILYGRAQRTKSKEQITQELEALYNQGWRGGVFFVDDNFIGNKHKLKKEILPAIIEWMREKNYPFNLSTEASVNLSDDKELMELMQEAGFKAVFLGIETPDEGSLKETGKLQNVNKDLVSCVKRIQRHGMEVQGGFIVGFDNDTPSIFDRQIEFIQKSGIVTAMVGTLNVLPETKLYYRLKKENRLLNETSGNNTDSSLNFVPKMNSKTLVDGYRKVIRTIYSPKFYYRRVMTFLREYKFFPKGETNIKPYHFKGLLKSIWLLGIKKKDRFHYWKLFWWTLFTRPKYFPLAITFAIYRYHFGKVFNID